MIQVMHWVVRSQRKKLLLNAQSVSVSVDDRADFRLVRYRCSYRSWEDFTMATAATAVPAVPALSKSSTLEEKVSQSFVESKSFNSMSGWETWVCLLQKLRIYFGKKVHYLCTRAGVQDIRAIMSEMGNVVTDMLDRVQVDLTGDMIAMCLEVFNVRLWADKPKASAFQGRLQVLAKVLHLNPGVCGDFAAVARLLRKVVQAASANKLQTSNRQVWSWFLCSEWRLRFMPPSCHIKFMVDMEKLIGFYLALKVNTTTLERNLGQLCHQLHSHSGPCGDDGRLLSAVLLVALDGPKAPEQLFHVQKSTESGDVQANPTDFSVACAKLWLATYGRRFRYKYEKVVGSCRQTKPGNRKRKAACKRGTFEWVKKQRKLATSSLCKAAQDSDGKPLSVNSYVPDIQLPLPSVDGKALASAQAMSGTRWQSSATGGQGLNSSKKDPAQLFREHTERKRARLLRLEWSIFVCLLEFHYYVFVFTAVLISTLLFPSFSLTCRPKDTKLQLRDDEQVSSHTFPLSLGLVALLLLPRSSCQLICSQGVLCGFRPSTGSFAKILRSFPA